MFHETLSKLVSSVNSSLKQCIPGRRKKKSAEEAAKAAKAAEEAIVIASRSHKHNVSKSCLYMLPAELLHDIVDHLPRTSAMALSVTCTRFYKAIASPILEKYPSKQNSFNILVPLERSLGPWNSKPLCGGCLTMHKDDFYWSNQPKLEATKRRCKSTQKLVWLHPDCVTSFKELKEFAMDLRATGSSYLSPKPEIGSAHYVNYNKKDILLLNHSITLLRFKYGSRPCLKAVSTLLKKFKVPICPHMTTGHPMVADIYKKTVMNAGPDDIHGWDHSCPVRNCKTFIHFRLEQYRDQNLIGEKLVFHISRCFNVRNGPERKGWLSQAVITPDKSRFRRSWRAAWTWKLLNDEIDVRKFKLCFPTHHLSSFLTTLRQEVNELIAIRDALPPPEDIRTLYEPLVPHGNTSTCIKMKDPEIVLGTEAFGNP